MLSLIISDEILKEKRKKIEKVSIFKFLKLFSKKIVQNKIKL